MPAGNGRVYNINGCTKESFAKAHNKSVFLVKTISGEENLCLAYALVLGKTYADNNENMYKSLEHASCIDIFSEMARLLCENAQVDLTNGGGYEHLRKFQMHFKNEYNIIVFNDRKGKSIFFRGSYDVKIKKKIYLILEDNHYFCVKSIHGAFSLAYYCHECLLGYAEKF